MLVTTLIFLAAAVIAVVIFQRLGLGSVLGYLAAGAAIGPSGFALVGDVEGTLHIAELGVVLMLFLIGLELQPARLWKMRAHVFGIGSLQVGLTTAVVCAAAMVFGTTWQAGIAIGVALAMSSTAVATQILGEKNELASPHGRSAFGILLFQDIAAIPALALIPLLGNPAATEGAQHPLLRVAVVTGVLAVLVIVGRFLLRPAFRLVATIRSQDLSTASALLVVIGTASAVHAVGLSMPLGAFLAGVLLADSEYRHELEADIEPFKGLLLGLFFVAVGMSANLKLLASEPLVVVGLTLGLLVLKAGVLFGIGRFTKLGSRNAASLAIAASQGGEFAFVIFADAMKAGVLGSHLGELLVVVVTLSLIATPILFVIRDAVFKRLGDGTEKREYDAMPDDHSRVIIAGFGRVGQIVGRILLSRGIPFTALDASAQHVDFVRNFGNRVYYGDASRLDLLRSAKADKAEVFVLAIDDFEASMRTLKIVQENFPNLHIVARARNRQHAYALLGEGVTQVVRENFFGSVEMSRLTLEELGFTSLAARRTANTFAEYDEAQVRKAYPLRHDTKALIASAKSYAQDLEEILKQDEREAI